MEKQVLFKSRVDIIKTADHVLVDDPYISSPDSAELEMSQVSLQRVNSTGHSTYGLLHSTQRGTTNYNYGYSSDGHCHERKPWPTLWTRHSESTTVAKWKRLQGQQRWCTWVCWTCIALLSLLLTAALATVLAWCIIIPRRPDVQVVDGSTRIHYLNASKPHSDSAWNFTMVLRVRNPNRVATDYSSFSFESTYNGTRVGEASIPAFSQRAHARKEESVNFLIKDADGSRPLKDANVTHSVLLQIAGHVQARLQILGLSAPPVMIRLLCSIEIKGTGREARVLNSQCDLKRRRILEID